MSTATQPLPPATVPTLHIADGRATVRLNRPAMHNRLEPADLDRLVEIFGEVAGDSSCRVLVITATGKSFSSGFHIGALAERKANGGPDYDPDAFEKMVNTLEALPLPTIAAINGGIYGGATDLALACDFRIGVEGMRMFMPAAKLGIVYYSSGARRYVSRLGLNNAKKLFMTAAHIRADELIAMGYLTELVAPDELASAVDSLAGQLSGNAPLALAGIKKTLNDIAAGCHDPADNAAARQLCSESDDHREALKAWQDKRAPVFKGH